MKLPDVMVPVNASEYAFMNQKKRRKATIITIPHGVDVNLFKPLKKKSKLLRVGYVGRLAPIKYPEVALRIFKNATQGIKNTEFWWIGPLDHSYPLNYFETLKQQVGVTHAQYFDRVDNEQLPVLLNQLDIFLQVEQQKNVSRSTTEAAACGLPVVGLNIGKEAYGLFSRDEGEVTTHLTKLLNSKQLREEEGKRNREIIVQHFSEESIYDTYISLFETISHEKK